MGMQSLTIVIIRVEAIWVIDDKLRQHSGFEGRVQEVRALDKPRLLRFTPLWGMQRVKSRDMLVGCAGYHGMLQ
jgi:hypothetical protein